MGRRLRESAEPSRRMPQPLPFAVGTSLPTVTLPASCLSVARQEKFNEAFETQLEAILLLGATANSIGRGAHCGFAWFRIV